MQQEAYWVWLQQGLGYASHKLNDILSLFHDAQAFYHAGIQQWRLSGLFTNKELSRLEKNTLEEAQRVVLRCKNLGQEIVTPQTPSYPQQLLQLPNPPAVLYVKGSMPNWEQAVSLAIVGTRSATPYGLDVAFQFACQLAKAGVVIVSGGALGVDGAAHRGALQAGGVTVAVLGCGINYGYLYENASLRETIAISGALVSEYPPDTPPTRYSFPVRNRLISGLALGTLVVEAGERSGSLITANLALEQNRDVFAVPGNVNSSVSDGTNNLIKAGATAVTKPEDILAEYLLRYPRRLSVQDNNQQAMEAAPSIAGGETLTATAAATLALSDAGKTVYHALEKTPVQLADLALRVDLAPQAMMGALTELELAGLVNALPGKRYQKV
ncbi:MAG TPA: DNA-protecting protein DprA [Candidatus Gallacutalibacter stercoravium]|nr:DNA-protecting protein DprA [Candidatus Gallacutalibacter stercoravium]